MVLNSDVDMVKGRQIYFMSLLLIFDQKILHIWANPQKYMYQKLIPATLITLMCMYMCAYLNCK